MEHLLPYSAIIISIATAIFTLVVRLNDVKHLEKRVDKFYVEFKEHQKTIWDRFDDEFGKLNDKMDIFSKEYEHRITRVETKVNGK